MMREATAFRAKTRARELVERRFREETQKAEFAKRWSDYRDVKREFKSEHRIRIVEDADAKQWQTRLSRHLTVHRVNNTVLGDDPTDIGGMMVESIVRSLGQLNIPPTTPFLVQLSFT